jgi:hypothetical protein
VQSACGYHLGLLDVRHFGKVSPPH